MIAQVVYLDIIENKLAEFITEITSNALASSREPGITRFDVLQQADNPLKFVLYEVYRTQADLEAHRLTPHYKHWLEVGVPMLSGERTRKMYQMLELAS